MRKRVLVLLFLFMLPAWSAPAHAAGKFFFGGGLGFGFGNVTYTDVSAILGYRINPRWMAGVRGTYRSRTDKRFASEVNTSDYGASVFARFRIKGPWWLHGEYEYLNFESIQFDLSTERRGYSSILFGGGVAQPISKNVSIFATALYNLSYDSSDLQSPYDSPFILRAGIGIHF